MLCQFRALTMAHGLWRPLVDKSVQEFSIAPRRRCAFARCLFCYPNECIRLVLTCNESPVTVRAAGGRANGAGRRAAGVRTRRRAWLAPLACASASAGAPAIANDINDLAISSMISMTCTCQWRKWLIVLRLLTPAGGNLSARPRRRHFRGSLTVTRRFFRRQNFRRKKIFSAKNFFRPKK